MAEATPSASVVGTALPKVNDRVIEYYKKIVERRSSNISVIDKLEFGKFKGRPFSEVLQNEPSYCIWCLSHLDAENKHHEKFLDFMVNAIKDAMAASCSDTHGEGISSSCQLGFGKHKGRTFGEVFTEEPAYCKWCLSHLDAENKQHKDFLDFIKNAGNTGTKKHNSDGTAEIAAIQVILNELGARVELLELTTVRRMKVKDMNAIGVLAAEVKK